MTQRTNLPFMPRPRSLETVSTPATVVLRKATDQQQSSGNLSRLRPEDHNSMTVPVSSRHSRLRHSHLPSRTARSWSMASRKSLQWVRIFVGYMTAGHDQAYLGLRKGAACSPDVFDAPVLAKHVNLYAIDLERAVPVACLGADDAAPVREGDCLRGGKA